jgi:WhiB family redox-sensing transcriptional regulator
METRETPGTPVPKINKRDPYGWMDQAACRDTTERTKRKFYGDDTEQRRMVKKYCRTCPVLDACRTYGDAGKEFGVWGGLTEADRHPRPTQHRTAVAAA